MEIMLFHIAHTKFFKYSFVSNSGGPNKNLAPMKNCPGVQGNLIWMPGYKNAFV